MARPSKVKSPKPKFAVFEDPADSSSNIPTSHSSRQHEPSSHSTDDVDFESELDNSEYAPEKRQLEDISEDVTPLSIIGEQTDTEVDDDHDYNDGNDDRRESALTRGTSISSLPESSVFDTDYDESSIHAMHKPYTPPSMRPTFRRPESVRRVQMMPSPSPYERSSPRRSALRAKARAGTLRSAKQSSRPKGSYYQGDGEVGEGKDYPLVLLHVTLLPVELRWSAESMLEVLPPNVIENLQLLRSKVSETILHRGILIPHPREEYELLEDRLLEALELRMERVSKCGHFRGRDSVDSTSSGDGSVKSADSGVAFNSNNEDVEQCMTCSSPVKGTGAAVDRSGRKWSIKVFAANGLMRAPAWTAAWPEMERVDIEILPWINESLRKQLDAMAEREEADERRQREDEAAHIKEVVEEQVRIAHEERKRKDAEERARYAQSEPMPVDLQTQPKRTPAKRRSDLPQVYRAADIPLRTLLKNYVFLLAQDKRNVAMFALSSLALWLSLRAAVSHPPILDLTPVSSICEGMPSQPTFFKPQNDTAVVPNIEALANSVNASSMVEGVDSVGLEVKTEDVQMPESTCQEEPTAIEEDLLSSVVSSISSMAPGQPSPTLVAESNGNHHEEPKPTEEDPLSSTVSSVSTVASGQSIPILAPESNETSYSEEDMQYLCANYNLASEMFALPMSLLESSGESSNVI